MHEVDRTGTYMVWELDLDCGGTVTREVRDAFYPPVWLLHEHSDGTFSCDVMYRRVIEKGKYT